MAAPSVGIGAARHHDVLDLRHADADRPLLALALLQGLLSVGLLAACVSGTLPPWTLIAWVGVSLWWGSNTLAHIHIHSPFFRSGRRNRAFALYLTALLGIPQSLWRARHLWHHAGEPPDRPPRVTAISMAWETGLILVTWAAIYQLSPLVLVTAWLPGWGLGLCLCAIHGHYEHAGSTSPQDPGISCYRRVYNLVWLNDGYHAEHHRQPGLHWSRLPQQAPSGARVSRWPPVLRWLDGLGCTGNRLVGRMLDQLERLALRAPGLQAWLVDRHAAALVRVLAHNGASTARIRRAAVVGGGLFPRTVLVLRRVLPDADLLVIDDQPEHVAVARRHLALMAVPERMVTFRQEAFADDGLDDVDLVIFPLAFRGDRDALYRNPPASVTLIHDWLWRRRGRAGTVVSPWLLKRLNVAAPQPKQPG